MKHFKKLLAIGIVAAPLAVFAQTANTPGGQAATGSALDKSTPNTSSAPSAPTTTSTTPDLTNPNGQLPGKTPKSGKRMKTDRANSTQPGDASTYPAPAKDGTPTK